MSGEASSSQLSVGSSGSGALSHVYIQYPPLQCSIPGSKGLYYDDGNKLLLSLTSDQIFSWKTVPLDPHIAPISDSISEGPIISIRYSLDAKFIAIQRSTNDIQFRHRESGECFNHRCKPESESILGFFWTDCPLCDFVLVKTSYGRIYCLQIDRVAVLIHLYRFYRDYVVQQGSLPTYSSKISVSVVDNVLLVHQVDAKVVLLYDIFADSQAPIPAPLPLLFRDLPRTSSSSYSRSTGKENGNSAANISDCGAMIYADGWTFLVPDLICDVANNLLWKIHLDLEAISASSFEVPSILEFLQRRKLEAIVLGNSAQPYLGKETTIHGCQGIRCSGDLILPLNQNRQLFQRNKRGKNFLF